MTANHTQNTGIHYKPARSILTRASGFIGLYDYTLNPYSGCTFGCNYCYAAFFATTKDLESNWGKWVSVKENALDLLKKKRKHPLTGKTIYMSSVTDPYQPIENKLGLTRALLEELAAYHQPKLVIQTRSPLVTRDLDLLQQFEHVQVNMTVTTDSEEIRKAFEPTCPSIEQRLQAITKAAKTNLNSMITMTPLLPVVSPVDFADRLLETGVKKFVVQNFHKGKVRFAAGTSEAAMQLTQQLMWTDEDYRATVDVLHNKLPMLVEGRVGFAPDVD